MLNKYAEYKAQYKELIKEAAGLGKAIGGKVDDIAGALKNLYGSAYSKNIAESAVKGSEKTMGKVTGKAKDQATKAFDAIEPNDLNKMIDTLFQRAKRTQATDKDLFRTVRKNNPFAQAVYEKKPMSDILEKGVGEVKARMGNEAYQQALAEAVKLQRIKSILANLGTAGAVGGAGYAGYEALKPEETNMDKLKKLLGI